MKRSSIITKIFFSPLAIWLWIGTIFLFLAYKFEAYIKNIGCDTKSKFYKFDFKPKEYHKINFGATFFFFVLFPFILVKDIVLFVGVIIIHTYEFVIKSVEELYAKIVSEVQLLWEKITKSTK